MSDNGYQEEPEASPRRGLSLEPPDAENRPGITRRERVGPWVVEAYWPEGTYRGGPSELHVMPAEDADKQDVARGISTATLRDIPLARLIEETKELGPRAEEAALKVGAKASADRERLACAETREEYCAALALAYADLAQMGDRSPINSLSALIGASAETIRAQVREARQRGLLTATPGKAGGELTDKARNLLAQLEKRTADRERGV